MFVLNQKVILPKSHGEKEGVIVLIPKPIRIQTGLTQKRGRVKVSYVTTGGGATEAWFEIDSLQAWRKPADITAELEAKHQKEMEAVHATVEKEKLDWIENGKFTALSTVDGSKIKPEDVEIKESPATVIEVDKNTDIKAEMKKVEAEPMVKKTDDNSDSYVG